MLNINSPTVQAMMQNTPQGFGNMPVYYGNTPSIDSTIQTPYPSPKEMLMQSGQQNIYAPVQFQSPVYSSQPQYVGGYNPGFDAAFAGYSNPYMGYGYSGYTGYGYNGYGYPQMVPLDPDAQIVFQMAQENGISFKDQLEMESNMYKQLSRITSKYLNRSEEDTVKHEKMFDIYNKFEQPQQQPQNYYSPIPNMHICIKVGTEIVSDIPSGSISYYNRSAWVQKLIIDDINTTSMLSNRYSQMHANAIERKFDDVDLVDFFNNSQTSVLDTNKELEINEEITALNIDLSITKLIIQEGTSFKVETNNDSLINYQKNNTLYIKEESGNWFQKYKNLELVITLPNDFLFTNVSINTGAGSVFLESLKTNYLDLEMGAGKVTINNLEVSDECFLNGGAGSMEILDGLINNLDLDVGVGKFSLTSLLTGNNKIDAGVGELNLNILNQKADYKIEVNKGIGSILIDSVSISDGEIVGNGSNTIYVDGGVGKIDIKFH